MSAEYVETEARMVTQHPPATAENYCYNPDNDNKATNKSEEEKLVDEALKGKEGKIAHSDVDSENVSDSNEYFQKVKAIEILASFWAFLQLGNSIIVNEVTYRSTEGSDISFMMQSLAISSLTSVGLTISIIHA
eukprot:CAMPEP_0168320380 /NCGR_PEP_ID=MMETSP0213-20121227/1626_1 /TAXON_ID=151035 /ORGANISM="Euplotes harpa, Strain FSP1.4" /LENGTH=133 /DNA_ID=CAMNT_0008321799 /DNA_START=1 /DNA_END=402 /DNA_ORIENTATION=+